MCPVAQTARLLIWLFPNDIMTPLCVSFSKKWTICSGPCSKGGIQFPVFTALVAKNRWHLSIV